MKRAWSRKNLWDRLPRTVRGPLGRALGRIPPRYILGKRFRENLRFLDEAQWWPAERARAYQLRQLQRLCTLARQQTAFYRRAFKAAGFEPGDLKSPDDIAALPTIDQNTLREHLHEMCAVSPAARGVDYASTGATSGAPLEFYINADRSATEYAYLVASWRRAGYELGTPLAVLRGRVVRPDRAGLFHEYDGLLRHHYYSCFHMTDENMHRYLEHVGSIGPCFLHVYPSSVAALARFVGRSGVPRPANVRGIIAESENVYLEQRRTVEATFRCRCFSCYGHSEKVVLASECEHSADGHVWPTYGHFELLDDRGRPVTSPGERGEIAGTGFINRVVPFIRYRTGDYATYVGPRCRACGREHAIIRDIRGHRTQEFLVAGDGSELSWASLNMHDDTFRHVRQFQFHQDTPGRAVLRIVPAEAFGEADRRRILRNLNRKLNGQLALTLQPTDSISLSPRGKAIYVDQRIQRPDRPGQANRRPR